MAVNFRTGKYDTARHTPGSAITAGDVVELGTTLCGIAHQDIAANVEGILAVGGGVYDAPATSGDVIAAGDKLYWNGTVAEEASSGGVPLGYCVEPKADGETTIRFRHDSW